jgi:hypothetical protein
LEVKHVSSTIGNPGIPSFLRLRSRFRARMALVLDDY